MPIIRNFLLPVDVVNDPRMSIPHCANGVGAQNGLQLICRQVDDWCEPLTLVALIYIFSCVYYHGWPRETCSEYLVSQCSICSQYDSHKCLHGFPQRFLLLHTLWHIWAVVEKIPFWTNQMAPFLTLVVSFFSCSNSLVSLYLTMSEYHSSWLMTIVINTFGSILFSFSTSTMTVLSMSINDEFANFERASAWLFSALGMTLISNPWNCEATYVTISRYFIIVDSLASYSPLICCQQVMSQWTSELSWRQPPSLIAGMPRLHILLHYSKI